MKGPYRAHRERQRARILSAAEGLFDEHGIDSVAVAEIVSATGIRASTFYEYFTSKDDIVWALLEQRFGDSQAAISSKLEAIQGASALVQISAVLDVFREELVQHPEHVRFMAQFDAMYAREWTVERLLGVEATFSPNFASALGSLTRQGIADGSLRADLDPKLTLQAVLNAVIGTQRRLASLGKRVEAEYGRPVEQLFDEAVRLLLLGLRASPASLPPLASPKKQTGSQKHTKEDGMNRSILRRLSLAGSLLACSLPGVLARAETSSSSRLTLAADSEWRFHLGDAAGAEAPAYADQGWRVVNLPHDWSIEGKPEADAPSGAGDGFFPNGVGWYRKAFHAPETWRGRVVTVEFDGIYRNATVYLNGAPLVTEPYGYTSFSLDLTKQLKLGATNILAVRVDNSAQPNSRWYSGSGIYRHVRMVVKQPDHVAHWGVVITTPEVTPAAATVKIETTLSNDGTQRDALSLVTVLYDRQAKQVGTATTPLSLDAGQQRNVEQTVSLAQPGLWSPATPVLYHAVTRVQRKDAVVDEVTTPFGVRSLVWSAEKGLLLNGVAIKLTGGSVHHDNGALGAAAFDRAEERRVQLLKAAGHNAVRTAHNIPSPAFLDACDRLGLLVLDEPFDVWEAHKLKADYASDFAAHWKDDLAAMVKRDRNHPAVILWGIGNEIPELTVEKGAGLTRDIVAEVKALDRTRPLTLAFPGTTTQPTAKAVYSQLDVTGYNYSLEKSYKEDHAALPNRLMLTTESFPSKAFQLWEISTGNPYVLGDLTWTSMDYLGESGIGAWSYGTPAQAQMASTIMNAMMTTATVDKMFKGMADGVDMTAAMAGQGGDPVAKEAMAMMMHGYPWHAADCGDLDLTGFRKPQSYYRDILWNGGDRVFATVRLPEPEGKQIIAVGWATYPTVPAWTWPGLEGKTLQVEVYSGAERVQLYLNGKLLGDEPTGKAQAFKAVFDVPYTPGELKAVGLRGGRRVAESVLRTTGRAVRLRLTADRTAVQADGQDLAFFNVEAVDKQGATVMDADENVTFTLDGPGLIAGVGNGDGQDPGSYQGHQRKLFHGRAQVIVRTEKRAGRINLRAETAGLQGDTGFVTSSAGVPVPELQDDTTPDEAHR